jgi:hypothetical protein
VGQQESLAHTTLVIVDLLVVFNIGVVEMVEKDFSVEVSS